MQKTKQAHEELLAEAREVDVLRQALERNVTLNYELVKRLRHYEIVGPELPPVDPTHKRVIELESRCGMYGR